MKSIEVKQDGLYLDGEKFFLLSGDFHYFRTFPEGWRERLELMKDFGLTAVTTYVAWNLHEEEEGKFNFEGIADLPRFLKIADEVGLKVILRCSPYMCAEWEMGGLPAWLLKDRQMCLRSSDPKFIKKLERYFKVLGKKIKPYLYTNGGPVILAGLENEYGSFGNDREYLKKLAEIYRKNGIDVPFISANGSEPFKYVNGIIEGVWNGVDSYAGEGGLSELDKLKVMQPDKPLMAGEAWCGRIQFWGKSFALNNEIEDNCLYFKKALEMGAIVNFYMFCGGTNFAFYNGALSTSETNNYTPLMTSYDYDAPISEEGTPREKYFQLRDVLDEFLGKPKRPHVYEKKIQSVKSFKLDKYAPIYDNLDVLAEKRVHTYKTLCMEDLGQNYGFISYTTKIKYTGGDYKYHLRIEGLADRATVYLDGNYLGFYMREVECKDIIFKIEKDAELTILVENMGRINYGYGIYDYKGILNCVRFDIELASGKYLWNYALCMNFETATLPFKSLKGLKYSDVMPKDNTPCIYRGEFNAEKGVDSFINMAGWEKGVVFINGVNIGRYWSVGPQKTLYVPGELLKENNVVEIFEIHKPNEGISVEFVNKANLTELENEDYSLASFELK